MKYLELDTPYINKRTGAVVVVKYDEHPESPREWSNLGKMDTRHRKLLNLDESGYDKQKLLDMALGFRKKIDPEIAIVLPISMHDHGGYSIHVGKPSCRFDSGYLGTILATKKDIREWFGVERISKKLLERAWDILRSEVKEYNQYVNGEIYCYDIYESIDAFNNKDFPESLTNIYSDITKKEELAAHLADMGIDFLPDDELEELESKVVHTIRR